MVGGHILWQVGLRTGDLITQGPLYGHFVCNFNYNIIHNNSANTNGFTTYCCKPYVINLFGQQSHSVNTSWKSDAEMATIQSKKHIWFRWCHYRWGRKCLLWRVLDDVTTIWLWSKQLSILAVKWIGGSRLNQQGGKFYRRTGGSWLRIYTEAC